MNSCRTCGRANRPDARFCVGCGSTMQASQAGQPLHQSSATSQSQKVVRSRLLLVGSVGMVLLLLLLAGSWWWLGSQPSETVENAIGTATVLIPTAIPGVDLDAAIEEAREYLDRNPKLTTALNELLVVFDEEGKEAALALASEKEMLDNEGYLLVVLELDIDDSTDENRNTIQALVTELESKEGLVDGTLFNEVTVRVPVEKAISQAESEGVESLLDDLTQIEHVQHVRLPTLMFGEGDGVVGQGVAVTSADEWHEADFRGQGVKVGIIDVGFSGYKKLLGQGLPDKVHLEPKYFDRWFNEEIHGTAVAEIVHEMAPEAELYFAIVGHTQSLNDAANWMADNGVRVINYSVGSTYGPFDGTGLEAKIVDQMAKRGVLWVKSAGNEAKAHWSGTFRDEDGDGWNEFAGDSELLPIQGGYQATLNWWAGNRDANYDLCVFDESGKTRIGCSFESQGAGTRTNPVERVRIQRGKKYQVAITLDGRDSSRNASQLELFVSKGLVHSDYRVAERSISNPADAHGALAVGAVDWDSDRLTNYSSQGPTADGRGKPELSAPTHVRSASYSRSFGGTSAAAPHVAGAAGLVLSAFPEMSRDELANYLTSNTKDLGKSGYDLGYGEGRLALGSPPGERAAPPPPPTPTPPVAAVSFSDDFSNPNSGLQPQAADDGWSSRYEDGQYIMTASFMPYGSSWELYDGLDIGDFTLNVEGQQLNGIGFYGVVFRVRDSKNYYIFQISDTQAASLRRVVNGSLESISRSRDVTVHSDQPNLITVEARGKQISVSINGEPFHTLNDDSFGHGTIGFMVTNPGLAITAGFDNLVVTP